MSTMADEFVAAFEQRDVDRLVGCFTADATYRDLFLGEHRGAGGLRVMFERMFAGPTHDWTFTRVLPGVGCVVAEWDFLVVRAGRRVAFSGVSVFDLDGTGRCRAYREYFDRGAALGALGTPPAVLTRISARLPTVTLA